MMKKTGLGRGLDALLPQDDARLTVAEISLNDIDVNASQPRKDFDAEALRQLADSIREAGVLQPLLVVERAGRYRIVAGERRFRAARLAGLDTVPCVVRDFSSAQQMSAALIENMQREDLNPMEEAVAVRALMDACDYTQEDAAKRLGRSRPAVANLLRLLTLPELVRAMVTDGRLSAGHARTLAGIDDKDKQIALARRCVSEGLSVRELEQLAAEEPPMLQVKMPSRAPALPLELSDMQERMRAAFGVKATLRGGLKKGKVVLPYASEEELKSIYDALERLENG